MRKSVKRTNSGKFNTTRPKSKKVSDKDAIEEPKKAYNDPSWYAASAELLRDSASLSYNNAIGVKMDLGIKGYLGNPSNCPGLQSSPGIMAFNVVAGPGISTDNSSAVNIAARNIYSYVRHQNSGHANYDSPDLMLYLLAMDEVYAFYNNLKRVYGVMSTYSVKNRYLPAALVEAMGFDYDDLLHHLPELRYYINVLANKINTLCVPATMTYMIRHSWLFSNVYMDSPDPKSQLYVFKQYGYRTYEEKQLPAALQYHNIPTPVTLDQIKNIGDTMLSKVIESEDMNIMSGDILKAYGEGNLFKVVPIDESYRVEPVYNEEVLMQIENMTILPAGAEDLDVSYHVDTNTIMYNPSFSSTSVGWATNKIINMHKSEVAPSDTMVATRLTIQPTQEVIDGEEPGKCTFRLTSMGSEMVLGAKMYFYDVDSSDNWILRSIGFSSVIYYEPDDYSPTDLSTVTMIEKFDWHPCIWLIFHRGQMGKLNFNDTDVVGYSYDLENYTVVDHLTLTKMHDTAILSEFGIGK